MTITLTFQGLCAISDSDLSQKSVLSAIRKIERKHISMPIQPYSLCTHFTLPFHPRLKNIRVDGFSFTFRHDQDPRFVISDDVQERLNRDTRGAIEGRERVWVRVSTHGRTPDEAGKRAIDAVNLLRGFWNLYLNSRSESFTLIGKPPSLNRILSGPGYTIHHRNGKLASESFWYERNYFAQQHDFQRVVEDWDEVEKTRKHWQRRLRRSNYRDQLESALRRYVTALDDADHEAGYLKLWSVLELLTNTRNANYDDTIRRASWFWRDRRHSETILQRLKERRNCQVHENTFDGDPQRSVMRLKRYVESLLRFHLNSHFEFDSIAEASELLDLPTNKLRLQRRQKIIDEALEWPHIA